MVLAENEEREETSPFYTAALYRKLKVAEGLNADGLAERLGKKKSAVYNVLMLADLEPQVQKISRRLEISLSQWLEIAKLPKPEDQIQLAQECAEKGYSVRELQARVKKLLNPVASASEASQEPKQMAPFRFSWKGDGVVIKARPILARTESIEAYLQELRAAFTQFMEEEPVHAKAA